MFSGAVKIGDLNDFIAPSQACVVNLEGGKLAAADDAEVGTVQLQHHTPQGFSQTLPAPPDQPVKVSLHDCLACSGCVTSAETVLLQHQSAGELLQRLRDPAWTVVVSLSPQSVAALAALYGLATADCAGRLAAALRSLGATAVLDTSCSRQLALAEAAAEFLQRYRSSARGAAALAAAGPAAAAAAGQADAMDVDGDVPLHPPSGSSGAGDAGPLPMLASACPGWVCYAEKTHGDHALPHIATGKSPQAVMGSLVKRRWCSSAGRDPALTYHCAVMPCYDKKLEAAREDFLLPGSRVPETDSVLATSELQELLQDAGLDLRTVQGAPLDAILPPAGTAADAAAGRPQGHPAATAVPCSSSECCRQGGAQPPASRGGGGSTAPAPAGSGGYLEHVFRAAAAALFGRELPPGPLPMRVGRNADLLEISLELPPAAPGAPPVPALRFAAAYGFRNIQGLMRRIKLGRCEYDYVEVMACPSGCLNGGGQPKPTAGQSAAQLLEQLEALYADGSSCAAHAGNADPRVRRLYREWVGDEPGSAAARQLLHTQYHKREKTVTATLADW